MVYAAIPLLRRSSRLIIPGLRFYRFSRFGNHGNAPFPVHSLSLSISSLFADYSADSGIVSPEWGPQILPTKSPVRASLVDRMIGLVAAWKKFQISALSQNIHDVQISRKKQLVLRIGTQNRISHVSTEKGLLQEWPDSGPPLEWLVEGKGQGIASVSIAEGKVYSVGYANELEYAFALNQFTGE